MGWIEELRGKIVGSLSNLKMLQLDELKTRQ
jgi:hypothetical protein